MLNNFVACLNAFWTFDGVRADDAPGEKFATSYGVTEFSWNDAVAAGIVSGDMNDGTRDDYALVLRVNFWERNAGDSLPAGVDLMVFNDATLSGDRHAATLLQRIVGVEPDGVIGPLTLAGVAGWDATRLIAAMVAADDVYLAALRNAPLYLKGWTRRELYMQTTAIKMVVTAGV